MNKRIRILDLVIGMALFHMLFWHERIGLNAWLFSLITLIYSFGFNTRLVKDTKILIYGIAMLLASTGVSLFNSIPSKIAFFVTFFVYIGYVWRPDIKTVISASLTGLTNVFTSIISLKTDLSDSQLSYFRKFRLLRVIKITIVPLGVVMVFFMIFRQANPVFMKYSDDFMEFINRFFSNISWAWIFFMLLGMMVISAILFKGRYPAVLDREKEIGEFVVRKRKSPDKKIPNRFSRFKNEFLSGVVMIIMVNILLLIMNLIDIIYIWFGFEEQPGMSYKQLVHEGTYYLILSIILSMIILLYFFRGSFNFYSKNRTLKLLSYIWIGQNGIMGVSVLIRNLLYIGHYGLAYKRIGVMIYLILVLVGLITMIIKIREKRSNVYLFRVNTLAAFIMLITMSLVNWDVWIAKYNLKHNYPGAIDELFLFEMSFKAMPLLIQNKGKLPGFQNERGHNYGYLMEQKLQKMYENREKNTFMSWNLADHKAYHYFDMLKQNSEKNIESNHEKK